MFGKRISVGVFHVCIKKKKKKKKKRKRKRKIVYEEKKKKIMFLKFQFKGVIGGFRRIVGELEFL